MKKAVYSLMILMLLLPLAACRKKKAPEDAADVGAAPDNHAAETAEDADVGAAPNGYTIGYLASNGGDEWLPDWQRSEPFGSAFTDVTPEMMNAYIEKLRGEGFELVGGKWAKMLYRDDVWIEISDNTEACESASVSVTVRSSSPGLTADEAAAAVGAGGMSKAPCALIDISPEGLFVDTGFGIFKALFDEPPYEGVLDPLFTVKTFMIGGGKAFDASGLIDAVPADIDGDGAVEAIVLEYGPTSGLCSISLRVFGSENGDVVCEAGGMFILEHSSFGLKVIGCKPFLVSGGRNYPLTVEGAAVRIDDPDNELGLTQFGR